MPYMILLISTSINESISESIMNTRKYKAKANIEELKTMQLELAITEVPALYKESAKLILDGWEILVVNQKRGRCYFSDKTITIPLWALQSPRHNYWIWYVAHEFSHATILADTHSAEFMKELKRICPADCIHYELEYMPKEAKAAGITQNHYAMAIEKKYVITEEFDPLIAL